MANSKTQSRSLLTYRALSFDIFGTLIDQDTGIYLRLKPLLEGLESSSPLRAEFPPKPAPGSSLAPPHPIMEAFKKFESRNLRENPTMLYEDVLRKTYKELAASLKVTARDSDADTLATSIGTWPAFPDTVAALQELGQRYKLVPLTNMTHSGINAILAGPFADVHFDSLFLAEDIGSYKPDKRNFEYLFRGIEKNHGIQRDDILHVAHGVSSDQIVADELELDHVWVQRGIDNWSSEKEKGLKYLRLIVPDMKSFVQHVRQEADAAR